MKQFYRNLKMACLITLLSASTVNLMAQVEKAVPAGSLLNEFIHGDTTANGERNDDNTVYVLERGTVYEISNYIRLNVALQIKSAPGDGIPAIMVAKPNDEGDYPQTIRTRGDILLEDVYLSNANGEGSQPKWGGFRSEGANTTIVLRKCLIEMDKACALQVRENGQDILIEDCIVGKSGDYNRNNGNGRLIDCREFDVEKIEVRNTTLYHLADRIVRNMSGGKINTFIFDQNTGLQIQGYHGLFHLGYVGSATITNNLFLNPKYMGNWTNVSEQTGPSPDNENHYLVTADTIDADTEFVISNNNFYYDDDVLAFYGRYDTVSRAEVLAPIVATEMGDDAANAGWDIPFTFDNPIPTINYDYLDGLFTDPTADPTPENWPMPDDVTIFNINLDFTTDNNDLITGSTTGGQLGDLNWTGTGPVSINNSGVSTALKISVYPNPVKAVATFDYTLTKASNVELKVFDVTGKAVSTLKSDFQAAGSYQLQWDGSKLNNGLYIYMLKSNDKTFSGKVTLNK
ncbi:MAG: T9SS type A sorting domain-containing protein [Salinivirgaceae bacterium]|jgi:hypothetical protein|nr:T9SS type A sorting domain-containing protein [Salinivirgaceae bacterium]